jgi:hypothetical protein
MLTVIEFHKLIAEKDISLVMYTRITAFAAKISVKIFSDLKAL